MTDGVDVPADPNAANHPSQQSEPHGPMSVLGPILPGTSGVDAPQAGQEKNHG
jgi:hypothetical protein